MTDAAAPGTLGTGVRVYLGPMEGVLDYALRKILCARGGYSLCFSEFVRVADEPLTAVRLLHRVPELKEGGVSAGGTPVAVQLLGDDPHLMAKAAALCVRYGAPMVDINFGCPAKAVRHAGALLLREPELMRAIALAVAGAVGGRCKLSAKIRAGFQDKSELPALAAALAGTGISMLTVHCRTRSELYDAAAVDWSCMRALPEAYPEMSFTVNGEINSAADARESLRLSGAQAVMCARGALSVPNLGHVISEGAVPANDAEILLTVREFGELLRAEPRRPERIVLNRMKQYLGYARRGSPFIARFFPDFCRCQSFDAALKMLDAKLAGADVGTGAGNSA